MAIALPVSK